jgi:hypothetical protein
MPTGTVCAATITLHALSKNNVEIRTPIHRAVPAASLGSMRWLCMGSIACLLLVGCGGGDDANDGGAGIADAPLSGKVGGQAWTLASAQTDAFLSDEQNFWVDVYAEAPASECGAPASGNSLILNVPRKTGSYPLSFQRNGTFVVEQPSTTNNLIATQGSLRVDEVTSTTLRGGVSMTYDSNNSVSGSFEAVVCP